MEGNGRRSQYVKKNHWLLAALSAALLLAGIFPHPGLGLSWLAFFPLFYLAFDSDCRPASLFFFTLIVGIAYFGMELSWILLFETWIYFALLGCVILIFPLYFVILRFLTHRVSGGLPKILTAVFLWFAVQKLYSLTPIGTAGLEIPFDAPLPFLQIASLAGIAGWEVVVIGLSAAGACFLRKRCLTHALWFLIFVGIFGLTLFWGNRPLKADDAGRISVALIQHNLPMSGNWRITHQDEIPDSFRELAMEAAGKDPDLIIFPLYTFPEDILRNPEFFMRLARETETHILVASHIPTTPNENLLAAFREGLFDAALLYSPDGRLIDHYQAFAAPPFREIGEVTAQEYKVLESPFGKLGILLCYEDTNPEIAKQAVQKGAEVLIALSNPGHFTSTHLPYYHLFQDRLRAIETRRSLARVSPNGYSAILDPKGKILEKSQLDEREIVYGELTRNRTVTPYVGQPDWFSYVTFLWLAGMMILNISPNIRKL